MAVSRAPMLPAFVLCLLGTAAHAQTPQPSAKFHAEPTHKKLECGNCHVDASAHLADAKAKPKLARDDTLRRSCHTRPPQR